MDRRKMADVLFCALQCAKSDRMSFIDAYRDMGDVPEVREAQADIRAFERLQEKLFGTTRSQLDAEIDKMIPVSLFGIRKFIDDNPELVINEME